MLLAVAVLFDGLIVMAVTGKGELAATVSDSQTSSVVALLALGGVLWLFAANGRKLAKATFGKNSLDWAEPVSPEQAKKDLEAAAKTTDDDASEGDAPEGRSPKAPPGGRTIEVGDRDLVLVEPGELPVAVVAHLHANASDADRSALPNRLADVEYGARTAGRGNHPWFLKIRGHDVVFKVSYGGQAKGNATVTKIET